MLQNESSRSSAYRREFQLRQITPLLCFQPKQTGATLRASEVLPQFRHFLAKYADSQYGISEKIRDFLGKNHAGTISLKMQIYANGSRKPCEISSAYFGNMGKEKEGQKKVQQVEALFWEKPLTLVLMTKEAGALQGIDELLEAFFLTHNFGTRANRGFGSFVLQPERTQQEEERILSGYYPNGFAFMKEKVGDGEKRVKKETIKTPYQKQIDTADAVLQALKSGVNLTKMNKAYYVKGYLFRHFLKKNICSEKRMIKQKMVLAGDEQAQRSGRTDQQKEYRYVRALLGLAGYFEFRDDARKDKVEIKNLGSIGRIPNPITVKPTKNSVYFLPNEHDAMLWQGKNAEYEFRAGKTKSRDTIALPALDEQEQKCWVAKMLKEYTQFYQTELQTEIKKFNRTKFDAIKNIKLEWKEDEV